MTYLTPATGTLPGAPPTLSRPVPLLLRQPAPCATGHLDAGVLRLGVALRREALQNLEAELVSVCETAAVQGDTRPVDANDRTHWDRPTWRRYLDTAVRLEGYYMPRMRRLRDDIARLERLLDLTAPA